MLPKYNPEFRRATGRRNEQKEGMNQIGRERISCITTQDGQTIQLENT